MNLRMVQRILGLMLMLFSLTMLPPVGVSLGYSDGHWYPFVVAFGIIAAIGIALWFPVRALRRDLRLRDGFLVVAVFWFFLGIAGATPLLLSDVPRMSFTDAVFEAVSGFTTTGATVIVGLDELPKSILYYRQQIQWFGGMGIIVLAVALLPVLGIGGMSLYKAETPGPFKDQKLTPRITQTAKALWTVYAALTAACAVAYRLTGDMDWFDAVGHAFSTLATGGFSTHDASFAHFDSAAVDAIATVFMFLGGVSFALHFLAIRGRDPRLYWRDPEFQAYFWLVAALVAGAAVYLRIMGEFDGFGSSLRHAAFQIVSIQTSTGFVTTGFAHWPGALPVVMMLLTLVCGCAGSTTGGMKVIRWLIVFRQGVSELKRLVHPSAEIPVKIGGRPVPMRIIGGVAGFFAMYFIIFAVLMFMLMMLGLDQVTAWSAVATCLNNVGPGLGDVSVHFQDVPDAAKWISVIAMLAGRVEIFTFILLLTPAFWQR
ncbi:MAG TPA: TrkH family potassium uptake protein [Steroidobacteraceae bacterium]|nr:TrkH family potassium uptake protein [Steroidobacteraceae bacterium]